LGKLRSALEEIRKDFAEDGKTPGFDFRTTAIFVSSTVLLTVFYYYGKANFYRQQLWDSWDSTFVSILGDQSGMAAYAYWGGTSLVIRVVVPALIIALVLRESPRDYGYRVRGQWRHSGPYIAAYFFMLPFLYWASAQQSFQARYPFYSPAGDGGATFWLYELFYGLQFVGVEAFFRGFMLFGLFKKFGYNALLIVAIPYVMIHFNKPVTETLGALVAGIFLGYLALKSKSFFNGILLHFGIAVTMDIFAIAQKAGGLRETLRAIF
jgi:membrane protease YdiL (CAAX protease family)